MTAFVILHYRAIDTTRSCVKSIRALAGDKHIVIVDNASPNGTGKVLAEEFSASPDVTVLLHDKNDGFARGNNVGTRWVCTHLDADFTVVLNNDVEIPQHDFISQIARIYAQHPFDLLGPDIVSVFSGIHQSPKTLHGCTLESVRAQARLRCAQQEPHPPAAEQRREKQPRHLAARADPQPQKAAHRHHAARGRRRAARLVRDLLAALSCPPSRAVLPENVHVLRDGDPRLALPSGRQRRALRPSISVLHYQYVASKMEYRSIVRRSKFVIDCLLDSLDAAEALILASEASEPEGAQPVNTIALADA